MSYTKNYMPEINLCIHTMSEEFYNYNIRSGLILGMITNEIADKALAEGQYEIVVRGVTNRYIKK